MRRFFTILLLVVVFLASMAQATAETNLTEMSTEDLLALRAEINNEIAARYEPPVIEEGKKLIEVFPDKTLARFVRDQVGLFSTNDRITQDQLDTITRIDFDGWYDDVLSLEGIQYLTNLKYLRLWREKEMCEIPEKIGDLQNLKQIDFHWCGITHVPDSICNLTNLEELTLYGMDIEELPEDIGNLQSLKKLNIGDTKIKELPSSIYNLKLEEFGRDHLDLD